MSRAPVILGRDQETILAQLLGRSAGFTPEWQAAPGSAGHALLSILARYLELQGQALDQLPERLRLSFLNSLGNGLLPAHAARAPVVFTLMENASLDVSLPRGTRVAAVLPPPPPTLEDDSGVVPADPQFYTEQTVRLVRGKLAGVYSLDPTADTYADHSAALATGFTLFDEMRPVPHELYLGHNELLRLAGNAEIALSFDFWNTHEDTPFRPLLVDWEYLSKDGWLPLQIVEDKTKRMTRDGKLTLRKDCGPDAKAETVGGYESHWIRGRVSARLPSAVIGLEAPGWWLALDNTGGLEVGDRVTVNAQGIASVLAVDATVVVLDRQLEAALKGALLRHADNLVVIGTIERVFPGWRLAVEDGREFLVGDQVTVDGRAQAQLIEVAAQTLALSRPLSGAEPGSRLVLDSALPPLRPEGLGSEGRLPNIDVLRMRVGFTKSDLQAEAAYTDTASIDLSNNFWPFGRNPQRFTTFYLASGEVFARHRARVTIIFTFAQPGASDVAPVLSPEYYNGQAWAPITEYHEWHDATVNLTEPANPPAGTLGSATLFFVCPGDWSACEVNGEENHWLRLRLDKGDYGHPARVSVVDDGNGDFEVQGDPETLQPPIVSRLRLQYSFFTNPEVPAQCITYNDFAFTDHSRDVRWPNRPFAPFTPVADRQPALHLGFSSPPPVDLVSLFSHTESDPSVTARPLPYIWEYLGERGWTELSVLDQSDGFSGSGMIQFVGAPDAVAREGLGGELYRVRARLKRGYRASEHRQQLRGLWLNALWASQGEAVEHETLGLSNGNPGQVYVLPAARVPVLPGESVEVREWTGRGEDWQTAVLGVDPQDLRFELDPRDQVTPTAVWVRWKAQPHLYASRPDDRHYVLDPAGGAFRFGGNGYGLIPPAGARIVASFATGGGLLGNVPANSITQLRSGVGYVQSVSNPLPASGGAQTEALAAARQRATERLRHRDRAVAAVDYEWLAREASPEVARARCLAPQGPDGPGQRGWVRMILVPQGTRADPQPTLALRETVLGHLARRMPAAVAGQVLIEGPVYRRVAVRAEIVPLAPEQAALVEARVRQRLDAWLHPLSGNQGSGWAFGEAVYLSAAAALIEATEGVDYARLLQLLLDDGVQGDAALLGEHELVAPGDHALKLVLEARGHATA